MTSTRWIRVIAARICGAATMERLVVPILADIELEYRNAVRSGRVRLRRWVLLRGYAGFCAALTIHAVYVCASGLRLDEPAKRTTAFSAGAFVALTFALSLPPLIGASSFQRAHLALYSVPQTVLLSIPIGLAFGILCGWASGTNGRAMLRRVLVLGIAGTLIALATAEWLLPAASQGFRATVNRRLAEAGRPVPRFATRGIAERSLSELAALVGKATVRRAVSTTERKSPSPVTRKRFPTAPELMAAEHLQFRLHQRLALCLAAAALTVLAVAVASAIARRNLARALFAGLFVLYVFGWYVAEAAAPALSPAVSGWLPNAGVVVVSAVLLTIGSVLRPDFDRAR